MEVTRTLVKSPPELWAELSDVAALARHLGEFGTIRIVRTEPESVVEWEGDRASGSVRLEPAGWGTRVTLTAEPVAAAAAEPVAPAAELPADAATEEPAAVAAPRRVAAGNPGSEGKEEPPSAERPVTVPAEPVAAEPVAAAPSRRRGFLARLLRRREPTAEHASSVSDTAPPEPAPSQPTTSSPPESNPSQPTTSSPPEAAPSEASRPQPPAPPEPSPLDEAAVLAQALHALGSAHHRPFSR